MICNIGICHLPRLAVEHIAVHDAFDHDTPSRFNACSSQVSCTVDRFMADCSQSLDLNVGRIVTFLVTFSRESNPSSMNSTIHERVVLLDLFLLLGMQQGAIS